MCRPSTLRRAGVAELVDALDLGSGELCSWRFKSSHPHHRLQPDPRTDHRRRTAPRATRRRRPATDGESTVKTKVDASSRERGRAHRRGPGRDAVKRTYERTVATVRSELAIPGFRKGHVPREHGRCSMSASDYLRAETLEDAIPEWGDEALRDAGLYDDAVATLGPRVAGPLDENADYSFSITRADDADARPSASTRVSRCRKREVEVTDDAGRRTARHAAGAARQRCSRSRTAPCRRATSCSWTSRARSDGELIEGAQGNDQMFEIGSGKLIPGFEEAVDGRRARRGEDFDVTFPDDYQAEELAGKPATFKVTVKEIKEKVVPAARRRVRGRRQRVRDAGRAARRRARAARGGCRGRRRSREFRAAAVDKAVAERHRRACRAR